MGSVTVVATILFGLSCYKLVLVDFTNITVLVTRAIVAFILFEAIKNKYEGFESTDIKPMHDCITFIIFPALLLCSVNMKIELLATFPLSIVCIFLSYKNAFAEDGDNMSCYQQGEVTAKNLFTRTLMLIVMVMYAIHDLRKTQIRHFIAQERAKKQ